ncbi:MAG: hypothetical protein HYX90_01865 [Chloroflexi bacterium]|nr:hypothetical protein [Chloroflexota bacterium]
MTVNRAMLNAIDGLEMSDRLVKLRKQYFDCQPGVVSDHVKLAMAAWKENLEEFPAQRQAKKLKKVIEGIPVVIHPNELLVGSLTKYFRGASPPIDYDGSYLAKLMSEEEGKLTLGGPVEKGVVTREDWQGLADAVRFFKGKTAADIVRTAIHQVAGTWYDDVVEAGGAQHNVEHRPPFLHAPVWSKVRNHGLKAIIAEAESQIARFKDSMDNDFDRLDFWHGVIIACQATVSFARRYSQLARDMAENESDPARRSELVQIAEACAWVPENPARTFHEALQSMIFLDLAVWMEASCSTAPSGWGLVDQELYPYFKRDLAEGRLTMEKTAELLGCFITYTARREWVKSLNWRDYNQKGINGSLSVGGPGANGEDASNELSYLILHLVGLLGYAEPHVPVRWHEGMPRWLMLKAIETNRRAKGGVPQFQNSDHIVRYWTRRGVAAESARAWITHGCSQALPADHPTQLSPSYLNVALPVDLALHNGVASATKKRLGPETGDPRGFRTFQEFYVAFETQCKYMFKRILWFEALAEKVKVDLWRTPLASALAPGCMEKGKDILRGGLPHYACWLKKDRGIIPAADSLLAVKKLVFDDKRLTMSELLDALDSNFAGERGEEIRRMCLRVPKYGNDLEEPDRFVHDVAKFSAGIIQAEKNVFGWPYAINRNGQAWHFANGKKMGALPCGRKAKEPLPDGSLSPMQGMDTRGPTAMLNSALKADFQDAVAGILNLKFPVSLFQSPETQNKLIDLTEGFFKAGGTYVQYNLLDRAELLEAKKHPEQYRDLVVRVGGYSAFFVTLSPEVQDDIIRRTEQTL